MDVLDQIFDLLSEERRRYALYYLEEKTESVSIDELVAQVAEWESDGALESIPEETFERIEVEFIHYELPRAAELQYVTYDQAEKTVELTDAPAEVETIIHVAKVIERPDRNP